MMRYQIRHKVLGIYQGSFLGLGFWTLLSNEPEQGLCEFPNKKEAQAYVNFLCSDECETKHIQEEFTIEPFDQAENDRLIAEGELQAYARLVAKTQTSN